MSQTTDAAEHHAQQLARLAGALRAFQKELDEERQGRRYRVIGGARHVVRQHAQTLDHRVEPDPIVACDEPELRTIATVAPMLCWHVEDRDDEQRLIAAADFARERLREVRDDA